MLEHLASHDVPLAAELLEGIKDTGVESRPLEGVGLLAAPLVNFFSATAAVLKTIQLVPAPPSPAVLPLRHPPVLQTPLPPLAPTRTDQQQPPGGRAGGAASDRALRRLGSMGAEGSDVGSSSARSESEDSDATSYATAYSRQGSIMSAWGDGGHPLLGAAAGKADQGEQGDESNIRHAEGNEEAGLGLGRADVSGSAVHPERMARAPERRRTEEDSTTSVALSPAPTSNPALPSSRRPPAGRSMSGEAEVQVPEGKVADAAAYPPLELVPSGGAARAGAEPFPALTALRVLAEGGLSPGGVGKAAVPLVSLSDAPSGNGRSAGGMGNGRQIEAADSAAGAAPFPASGLHGTLQGGAAAGAIADVSTSGASDEASVAAMVRSFGELSSPSGAGEPFPSPSRRPYRSPRGESTVPANGAIPVLRSVEVAPSSPGVREPLVGAGGARSGFLPAESELDAAVSDVGTRTAASLHRSPLTPKQGGGRPPANGGGFAVGSRPGLSAGTSRDGDGGLQNSAPLAAKRALPASMDLEAAVEQVGLETAASLHEDSPLRLTPQAAEVLGAAPGVGALNSESVALGNGTRGASGRMEGAAGPADEGPGHVLHGGQPMPVYSVVVEDATLGIVALKPQAQDPERGGGYESDASSLEVEDSLRLVPPPPLVVTPPGVRPLKDVNSSGLAPLDDEDPTFHGGRRMEVIGIGSEEILATSVTLSGSPVLPPVAVPEPGPATPGDPGATGRDVSSSSKAPPNIQIPATRGPNPDHDGGLYVPSPLNLPTLALALEGPTERPADRQPKDPSDSEGASAGGSPAVLLDGAGAARSPAPQTAADAAPGKGVANGETTGGTPEEPPPRIQIPTPGTSDRALYAPSPLLPRPAHGAHGRLEDGLGPSAGQMPPGGGDRRVLAAGGADASALESHGTGAPEALPAASDIEAAAKQALGSGPHHAGGMPPSIALPERGRGVESSRYAPSPLVESSRDREDAPMLEIPRVSDIEGRGLYAPSPLAAGAPPPLGEGLQGALLQPTNSTRDGRNAALFAAQNVLLADDEAGRAAARPNGAPHGGLGRAKAGRGPTSTPAAPHGAAAEEQGHYGPEPVLPLSARGRAQLAQGGGGPFWTAPHL